LGEFIAKKLVLVSNWFTKLFIYLETNQFKTGLKPKPVFTFIFVKLKPVHRTDQTPSRCGLTVGLFVSADKDGRRMHFHLPKMRLSKPSNGTVKTVS